MWTSATLADQNDVAGSTTVFDALGGFTTTEKHNITGVVRVIARLSFRSSTAGQLSEGAFGLILASDDAIAIPQVNDPFLDADSGWMMHSFFHDERSSDESQLVTLDNRARRRIPIKYSLAFALDVSAASGSVEWTVSMRILLQRGR